MEKWIYKWMVDTCLFFSLTKQNMNYQKIRSSGDELKVKKAL